MRELERCQRARENVGGGDEGEEREEKKGRQEKKLIRSRFVRVILAQGAKIFFFRVPRDIESSGYLLDHGYKAAP